MFIINKLYNNLYEVNNYNFLNNLVCIIYLEFIIKFWYYEQSQHLLIIILKEVK